MTSKNTQSATLEEGVYSSEHRRIVSKGFLIASLFLLIFALFDFFYTKLYFDVTIQAIGSVILLSLAYIEKKKRLSPLSVIVGLAVVFTVMGSGAFSNNVQDSGIVWAAFIPFLTFFLLGEKLGLKVSVFLSVIYISALTYTVIYFPEKGFNFNAIFGVIGVLFCSTLLSITYERNRTTMIRLLEKEAKTDSLTSLLNRRGLIIAFEESFLTSQKNETDLYLFVLDLDNFKLINDNFGHDVGDIVIKKIANTVKNTLRNTDHIARIGGEEFIAVLSDISQEKSLAIAENIRLAIERLEIKIPNTPSITATVSIGITKKSKEKAVFSDFFKVADEALYEAKNNGRNHIVFKA